MGRRAISKQQSKRGRQGIAGRNGGIIPPRHFKQRRQNKNIAPSRAPRSSKNGAPIHSMRTPAMRNPKTELEAAVQRFVDLYDFAPIAYVSFSGSGRIEETNLAATQLLGSPRDLLIGRPFAFYTGDLDAFQHHLLCCRTSQRRVATELELKSRKGERIPVQLLSTPITSTTRNGALLYQTAIIDLSERKRHEQQLSEQARLLDLSNDAIIVRDRNDQIAYWNKGATKLYGYTRHEALGKVTHELLKSKHPEPLSEIHEKLLRDQRWQGEIVHTRRDGTRLTVFSRWALDRDAKGKCAYVLETNNDITERKGAERQQEALYRLAQRESAAASLEEIYEAALDTILSAVGCDRASILLFDEKQVMRFVAWRGLSKRYRKAVEGHSPWQPDTKNPEPVCIPDVDLAKISEHLKSTIKTEGIYAATFIPLMAEEKLIGKFMTYYNAPHVFTDEELKLATTIATQLAQGIRQKRDENALRESEARLRATVEQATAGMARCDAKGRIIFANRKLSQMLGYEQSELFGKSIAHITHPDDVKDNMHRFRQMIRRGKPFEVEKRYIRKNGSILWADVSASAVRDPDGKTQSTVAVIVDVTARKKAEGGLQRAKKLLEQRVRDRTRELRKANKELENEIERRKGLEGEILAVSDREQQRLGQELHDGLCQHLTAVAFMTRSTALRLKQHRVVDANDIDKIAELVNNAAIDTRNLSRALHRFDVDSAGLVEALQDLVDREIWRTPCRLEMKPSFRINDDAAAGHLYRIAREAVINANKHAKARQIVVKLERSRWGIIMRVIDDGVGLPNGFKPQQGLGYHIMKYRAQLMGGRLEIHPAKGGGACVSCYLPVDSLRASKDGSGDKALPLQTRRSLAI
jgi:PAS domain S-box-containing protein